MRRNLDWKRGLLATIAAAAGVAMATPSVHAQSTPVTITNPAPAPPFNLPDPASQPLISNFTTPVAGTQGEPTLKEILEKGLLLRRQYEFDFIAVVLNKVDNGELPRDLTLAIFQWARRKRARYPFPYFQRALQLRAEELGVEL